MTSYRKQLVCIFVWTIVGVAAVAAYVVLNIVGVSLLLTWPLLLVMVAAQVALWTGRGGTGT